MNDFQDWLMTLEEQPLTEDLKLQILSKIDGIMKEELITMLRNLSTI